MKKTLHNIGVLGCASIADRYVLPAIKSIDKFNLVGVASRSITKANRFARTYDCKVYETYQSLLDDTNISIVYIPLPVGLHYEWLIKALRSDKHVIVEKSFTETSDQALKVIQLAKEKNKLVMENFMFLNHPQTKKIRSLTESGTIGHIKVVKAWFGFPPLDKSNIRYKRSLGGGALLDVGTYALRASRLFLGEELTVLGSFLPVNPKYQIETQGAVLLKNKDGQIAQLAFGFDHSYQNQLEIWGTNGRLSTHRMFTPPPNFTAEITVESENGSRNIKVSPANHFIYRLKEFLAILESCEYNPTYQDLLYQAHLIDHVRQKASN